MDRIDDMVSPPVSRRKTSHSENPRAEEWIDPRWHRELNVVVEEDLWVLREADEEAVQVLTEWHEEQWESRKSHDVVRWSAPAVQALIASSAYQNWPT